MITINERSSLESSVSRWYEEASSSRRDEKDLSSRIFERSERRFGDSSHEDATTSKKLCIDVFKNISNNTSEYSNEVSSSQRKGTW